MSWKSSLRIRRKEFQVNQNLWRQVSSWSFEGRTYTKSRLKIMADDSNCSKVHNDSSTLFCLKKTISYQGKKDITKSKVGLMNKLEWAHIQYFKFHQPCMLYQSLPSYKLSYQGNGESNLKFLSISQSAEIRLVFWGWRKTSAYQLQLIMADEKEHDFKRKTMEFVWPLEFLVDCLTEN